MKNEIESYERQAEEVSRTCRDMLLDIREIDVELSKSLAALDTPILTNEERVFLKMDTIIERMKR